MPSYGTHGADGYKFSCSCNCGRGGYGGDAGTGVSVCVNDGGQNPTYMNSWCTFDCNYEACRTCVCDIISLPGANGSGGIGENVGGVGGMGGVRAPWIEICQENIYFCSNGYDGYDGCDGCDGWVCIKF